MAARVRCLAGCPTISGVSIRWRHGEPEPALHRQGRVGAPHVGRQHGQERDRLMAHGVCDHRDHEPCRGGGRAVRAQSMWARAVARISRCIAAVQLTPIRCVGRIGTWSVEKRPRASPLRWPCRPPGNHHPHQSKSENYRRRSAGLSDHHHRIANGYFKSHINELLPAHNTHPQTCGLKTALTLTREDICSQITAESPEAISASRLDRRSVIVHPCASSRSLTVDCARGRCAGRSAA